MISIIEYALMAGGSYISTRDAKNQFPTPQGWAGVKYDNPPNGSGFEAISFIREGVTLSTSTEIVISYAGTGPGWSDWIHGNTPLALGQLSDQFKQAADYYLQVRATNPGATISFTGHSLGGGLASLMAVMFGESATTFDQAPFRKSALTYTTTDTNGNPVTHSVAQDLLTYLSSETDPATGQPLYGTAQLQKLTDFVTALSTTPAGTVPNESNVTNINVNGEVLGYLPLVSRIGTTVMDISNSSAGTSSIDLHSQALLTAMLQSGDTATSTSANHTLGQASIKLPDLLRMIFDKNLYCNDPNDTSASAKQNFLEHIVRHQTGGVDGVSLGGDAMVTRFTADVWKLAQDGGLTLSDHQLSGAPNNVSKALTAFAMQMYYEDTANATNASKQLFIDLATANEGSNGIRFDMHDVSKDIAAAMDSTNPNVQVDLAVKKDGKYILKGFEYFQSYLNQVAPDLGAGAVQFTPAEKQLILSTLPAIRDWYVQAGASGMLATDSMNRGAFMLGGSSGDALVGGTGADLLVGNAGTDLLQGGQGNDTLLGGTGNDAYVYATGDGLDTILDSAGQNTLAMDGTILAGGDQYGDARVHKDAEGHLYVQADPKTLLIDGNIVIQNYGTGGSFGLTMNGAVADANPVTTRNIVGDLAPVDADPAQAGVQTRPDDLGNVITDNNLAEANRADNLYDSAGNDRIVSGGGDDWIYAYRGGDDVVEAGAGKDYVYGFGGNDVIAGGADGDILSGGANNDRLYADGQIGAANAIAIGNLQNTGTNRQGDWLAGGAGDDILVGSVGNDVLSGGEGGDLLIGGAGDDDILGDVDWVAKVFDWRVADQPDGTRLFSGVENETLPMSGAADVIYAGEGNDHVWGGFGNDVLFGEGGTDKLYGGAGNDIIVGGKGNDILDGGEGYDIYIYNKGDGADQILEDTTSLNTLRFGSGISSNDITLRLGSLMLDLGNGDEVHIKNFDQNDVFNSSMIGEFEFDDGTTLTTAELLARGFDLDGTAGHDAINGTNTTDRISGLAGDDILIAGSGDDTLDGGAGNDILQGGAGEDIYLFNLGDGQDTIVDGANAVGNVVMFGEGIAAGNTQFFQQGSDLLVKYGTQGDAVLIQNFAPNGLASAQVIAQFQFADGSQGVYSAEGPSTDSGCNARMQAFDSAGRLVGDFWQAQAGGYGNNTYHSDGSSSGSSYSLDGSYSNYTDDGVGNVQTLDYNNLGINTGGNWSKADGSHGSDVFNSDGSSSGTIHLGDGSYSTYTNDGHGNIVTFEYDASGIKVGEAWTFANGNYRIVSSDADGNVVSTVYNGQGIKLSGSWSKTDGSFGSDTFNGDGSSSGVVHHVDGAYNTYINDGQGQVVTRNFSWNGSLTGSNITETNGLHNVITSYDNAAGVKISETWIRGDGNSGSDLVSARDFNGALNLMTQVGLAYPGYGLGEYSFGSWTAQDGASGDFIYSGGNDRMRWWLIAANDETNRAWRAAA